MAQITTVRVVLALPSSAGQDGQPFDVQGRRGCRGLFPENTLPAFEAARDLGVTTLELDFLPDSFAQAVGGAYVSPSLGR